MGTQRLAYTPATSMGSFLALCKEAPDGLIRSRDDWHRFVEMAADRDHPLHGVDAETINTFERQLVFGEMGLGGRELGSAGRCPNVSAIRQPVG